MLYVRGWIILCLGQRLSPSVWRFFVFEISICSRSKSRCPPFASALWFFVFWGDLSMQIIKAITDIELRECKYQSSENKYTLETRKITRPHNSGSQNSQIRGLSVDKERAYRIVQPSSIRHLSKTFTRQHRQYKTLK